MKPTVSIDPQPENRVDYALLSTSTTFSRLRGMTLWIMEILRDGGSVATYEVAGQTMKSCRYVNVYLNRLRKYGIARKHEGFWFLTDFGEYLADVRCRDRDRDRDRYNTSITQQQHNNNTSITLKQPKVLKQVAISLWLQDSDRNQVEKEVVEVLVKHYNETGSKFLYFNDVYHFADKFKIRPDQVNQLLMNLKQDRLVYSFKDKQHNAWKIGLYKAFIEGLKTSQGIT